MPKRNALRPRRVRPMCRSGTGPRADDRGSAAVELAVVTPGLVFLLLLVVFAGRMSEADDDVRRAASEAARAASIRQHPADAVDAAQATVDVNMATAGVECRPLTTDVDTGDFAPGGTVAVTVTCQASMGDLALLGVPGSTTFRSRSVEVIDRLRSTS